MSEKSRIEAARARIAEMRSTSFRENAMHHTLCSTFVDMAPDYECDCYVMSYTKWADYIEKALMPDED